MTITSFDLQSFISSIDRTGIARTNLFLVTFTPPAGVAMPNGSAADLTMRCEMSHVPGRTLGVKEMLYYGAVQKIPFTANYDAVDMTILLSPSMQEKLFFERWQDKGIGKARTTISNVAGLYDIGYYSDLIGTTQINQYDAVGNLTYSCKLIESYPSQIAAVNLDWNIENLAKLPVQMSYRFFQDENVS